MMTRKSDGISSMNTFFEGQIAICNRAAQLGDWKIQSDMEQIIGVVQRMRKFKVSGDFILIAKMNDFLGNKFPEMRDDLLSFYPVYRKEIDAFEEMMENAINN